MYAPPENDLTTEPKQVLPVVRADEEERFYKRLLNVPLSDKELLDLATKAANLSEEISGAEQEFKALSKDWKDRITGMYSTLVGMLRVVKDAKEDRLVECREVKNFTEFTVSFYYGDHLCDKRAMTAQERQPELPTLKDLDNVEMQERPTEQDLQEAGAQPTDGVRQDAGTSDQGTDEPEERHVISVSDLRAEASNP